ncbi:MAG: tetratricopeptide repeat protein, partial [Planctomycetia bacterium]|nr:tetratricopeptide repeat protein [Planctomycetia bacterium]
LASSVTLLDKAPQVDLTDVDAAVVQAIQFAQAAVQTDPNSAQAWGRLGMVLIAHEMDDAAQVAFAQAGACDPRDARWPYLQARAVTLGDAGARIAPLELAVTICGDQPDAPVLTLIESLIAVDRMQEAKSRLEAFLKAHPENARAQLSMSRCQLSRGDLARAAEHAHLAEDHPATTKAANELLAQILHRQGDKAESDRRRRIAATTHELLWPDPYYEEAQTHRVGLKTLLVRADKLFAAGNVEGTVPVLQEAVRKYPDSDWAHVLLGRSLIRSRRLPEAEQTLRKAVELAPTSVEAQFRLGVAIYMQQRPADAAEWFRKATALKPDFTMAHHNLGYCLVDLKEIPAAIEAFTAAAESDPNSFEAHAILGTLLANQRRFDEARTHLQRAVELKPGDAKARQQLQQLP